MKRYSELLEIGMIDFAVAEYHDYWLYCECDKFFLLYKMYYINSLFFLLPVEMKI